MNVAQNRLEHVRYISENFSYLRGWVIVLLGLPMLVMGLIRWWLELTDYAYLPSTSIFSIGLLLLVGTLIYFQYRFIVKANLYYAHTFGKVETSEEQKRRQFQIGWIVVVPMFIAFIFHFVFGVHNIFIASVVFYQARVWTQNYLV
jgi:Na+/H+ antiporter NhaD/arsenite permease-like protein